MTPEQEQNLIKRIEELEKKAIQVNLPVTERENIKNNIFEGWFDSIPAGEKKTYLKMMWKNQPFYIMTGELFNSYFQSGNEAGTDPTKSYAKVIWNGKSIYIPYSI